MGKKEKLRGKIQRQQEILNTARAACRGLTAEEQTEFESLQREIESLQREIEAEEGDGRGADPVGNPSVGNPSGENGSAGGEQGRSAEVFIRQERTRISEIVSLCREFDMDDQLQGYIDGNASVESVRAAVIERMRQRHAPLNGRVTVETDEQDKFRNAASDALLMRGGIEPDAPAEGARELRGMSLRDLAIECLAAEGMTGMNRKSADELFAEMKRQFFNPTAAFPAILDNAINKAYVEGHRTAPVTFDQWTKRGTLNDFKIHDNNYLAGPAGEFLEVPENGELKHDTWKDERRPTRKLKTFGRQFTMTRQAFVNDDIGAITRMPAKYAASARKTQNKQCYEILVNNPAVYDGVKLFDSAHGNLISTGTGITRESVQGMIMALSNQKDEFGEVCIIRPQTIVVPSGYKFEMYTLFFSQTIHTSDNTQAVNPLYQYRESIKIVEDPTINALCGGFGKQMPWWLLGAKEDTDFVEVDYLNGQDVPNIRRAEVPGKLGLVWDIYLDWGISVMDYRGAIKNPGIVLKNPVELA